MSRKKTSTKSSKKRARKTPAHIAAYIKRWNRKPDRADKRFYERYGRWPTAREFAFYDKTGRLPQPGELAAITRAKKRATKERRSIAAKRAAEKRRLKSPEVKNWEKARRALQAAQKEDVERASKIGIPKPFRAHRWYDFFYISLTRYSIDEIHGLLLDMKKRGVKSFRIEREVPVGEYKDANDFKSESGFISTKFQFMARLSESDLLYGNAKTGLPGLNAMRSPGIDVMRYLVIDLEAVRDHFPKGLRQILLKKKRETRGTIGDKDEQVNYLIKGTKFSAAERKMRAQRKAIDADLEEADEDGEDDEIEDS